MRAWLLLLAVLATSHTFVQVASTEDITSTFITAISPSVVEPRIQNFEVTKTTRKLLTQKSSAALMQQAAARTAPTHTLASASASASATTALATVFGGASSAISAYQSHQPTTEQSLRTTSKLPSPSQSPSQSLTQSQSRASDALLYANSESDSKNMFNNIAIDNVIIEIKNYEEFEGRHSSNAVSVPTEAHVAQPHRTNQLEVAKSNQNQTSIKQISISHNKPNTNQLDSSEQTKSAVQVAKTNKVIVYKEQQPSISSAASSLTASQATAAAEDLTLSSDSAQSNGAVESRPSTTSSGSSSHSAAGEQGEAHEPEDEGEGEGEPATYSSKEIIGQKVKPDPSTLVEIENSLLSLFNMKRPPKIDRSKIVIPEAMKQLYAEIMGHEIDSVNIPKPGLLAKSANTVRSFTHQDSKIDDRFPHHHRFRLHFDISSIPNEEKLKAAELQLSRDAVNHAVLNARQSNRTRYQVLVYDITRVGVRGKREPSYLLLDTKTVRLNSTETVSLDVQPAVDRWLGTPKKNFGLLVEVRTMRSLKPAPHHHVRLRRSADEPHDNWQHKQPLLFTYTDDGRHKSRSIRDVSTRSKRAGHRRPHRRKNTEENCRRHSLYVDFTDVGWSDWIVAPPGYDAFYCHGKCPFPLAEHLNSTNHAVVQTLVNNIHPGKVPKACCVPTQLEGISMLYLNDQRTVVLKNYQDMTVVGCGCR